MAGKTNDTARALTRRAALAALGAGFATPAFAQFGFSFGNKKGGSVLDLTNIFDALSGVFDGLGEKDEEAMARSLYPPTVERSGGAYNNSRAQDAIKRFAEPIFATSERSAFEWDITITNDNSLNAWALPGGKLGVNKGLLRHIDAPSELAAVISHEMAHAEYSHGLKMMQQEAFADGLTEAARAAIVAKSGGGIAGSLLSQKAMERLEEPIFLLVTGGYSQDLESAADRHIISVFRETGHDPDAASSPFKLLVDVTPKNEWQETSLLSSHPDTAKRIAAIDAAAADLPRPTAPPPEEGYAELKQSFPTRKRRRAE